MPKGVGCAPAAAPQQLSDTGVGGGGALAAPTVDATQQVDDAGGGGATERDFTQPSTKCRIIRSSRLASGNAGRRLIHVWLPQQMPMCVMPLLRSLHMTLCRLPSPLWMRLGISDGCVEGRAYQKRGGEWGVQLAPARGEQTLRRSPRQSPLRITISAPCWTRPPNRRTAPWMA